MGERILMVTSVCGPRRSIGVGSLKQFRQLFDTVIKVGACVRLLTEGVRGYFGKPEYQPRSSISLRPLETHVLAILLHIRNVLLGRESAQVQDDLVVGDLARCFVDCFGFRHFFVIVSASLQ